MIDLTTINLALYNWVLAGSTLTRAIWSDQNAPQPLTTDQLKSSAYVILRHNVFERIAEDVQLFPDILSGDAEIVGNREFTVYIEIKGKDALVYMNRLMSSLYNGGILETLRESGIVYVDSFPIQNITGLDDTQFIERASMDVLFRTASSVTETGVGIIESAEVSGIVYDVDGNIVYDETITIE